MLQQELTLRSDSSPDHATESVLDDAKDRRPLESPPGPASNPRLRLYPKFHSELLPNDRDLLVYVPEGYRAESDRRYPVLYLHDGQNLFDGATSYVPGRIWAVHETADRLIAAGEIEPLIVVGIYNTFDRLNEYTPTRDPKMGGGEADLYGAMLVNEIKVFIDSEYRTLDGPQHTGLGGSSLGGLVTLYLGLRAPETFGRLAVLSPSVWWNHKSILWTVNEAEPHPRPLIWLDMGTAEGKRTLRDSDLLYKLLLKRGWHEDIDLVYTRVPEGTHDEAAWAQRVGPFLKFLFPAVEQSVGTKQGH